MAYASDPAAVYDALIEDWEWVTHNGTTVPVREETVDEVAEHVGESVVEIETPGGTTRTLTGEENILSREYVVEQLAVAQQQFADRPVSTLTNLRDTRVAALHYTDSSAHLVVGQDAFEARGQRDTGPIPHLYESLGVRAAHLIEGFKIASNLPHHWVDDLGWPATPTEEIMAADGMQEVPDDRAPPAEECFVFNVPSAFPAQSFGQVTGAPAELVNYAIAMTETTLDETLLTERMAQLCAVERKYETLQREMERGLIDDSELPSVDDVARKTFNITESGLASLRSQTKTRRRKAFQTVRTLSESGDFNYVMEEYAETIDDLGELAMMGAKYREEVLDEPPGFY